MLGRMMVSALALTGVAYAQEAPPTPTTTSERVVTPTSTQADRVIYEAAQFAQFNPQTALDMVSQIPGFSLDGGEDRRGFSGAVGNVLIDGVRPSTKSQGVGGILSRIPASQVVRLEILRGAAVAGDASGQSTLLNVVRTESAGSGVYSVGFELTSRGVPAPRGEVSYSGRSGNVEYSIAGSVFSQYRDLPGWRLFFDEVGGESYAGRAETPSPRDVREGTINGSVAFPLWGGRFSTNAQINAFRFNADNDYYFFDALDNPDSALLQDLQEHSRGYEFGVNYDRDIGPWSLALIGLINRSNYESDENDLFLTGAGAFDGDFFQDIRQEASESIARASLSRSLGPHHRIEFGGEAAFNSLDQRLDLEGSFAPPSFDNANVLVEEERAEFFASHTWRPNDQWSVETRLNWETSTLTFTGDSNQTVDLAFWKPSVQITRTFEGNNQLRFRVYRDVSQLDFGDFVSAASTADSIISGGNPDLVPQTDWQYELGADLHFPGGAALALTLTRHQISDVTDVVYIPAAGFDAPGNLGDGEATNLDVNFSTPVSFIEGGRLTIAGYLWDTEVTDPLTNQPRIFSFRPESQIEVNFRQDLPDLRLAWNISVFKQGEIQAYRFNEIDTSEEGPWVDLTVETTALPYGMKLTAIAANLLDGTIYRDRRFFNEDPPGPVTNLGRNGINTSRDYRQREFAQAPWFILQLSGTF
ncbi:MAG: outer membrane beta-barrel protein [Alphaproteobacteria bacterium]|nr:outer membrane beta-barrel protein [Alphaproteobacteria bacterium]